MLLSSLMYQTLLTLCCSALFVRTANLLDSGPGLTDKFSHLIKPSTELDLNKEDILRTLESTLLNMFGFTERPTPAGKIPIPDYIMDMYHKHTRGEDTLMNFNVDGHSTSSANTVRSFHHLGGEDVQKSVSHTHRLMFNISTIPDEEVITAAELRLFRKEVPEHTIKKRFANTFKSLQNFSNHHTKQRVNLYQIIKPVARNREVIKRLIDTVVIDVRSSVWETLDVRPAVISWKSQPNSNYGLEVEIVDLKGGLSVHGHQHIRLKRHDKAIDTVQNSNHDESRWFQERPLLVMYTDDGRTKRSTKRFKRQRVKERKRKLKANCDRLALYVDFSDVGWNDWIVAPPGYQAYYCNGECPFPLPAHVNSTNHAIVQTIMNSANPTRVPRACCVPTELGPINMLYYDDKDQIVLKNYQEMVVSSCGCR